MTQQIMKTGGIKEGSIIFGVTSCNPSSLENVPLPPDPEDLLDRPEYWVVQKDVAKDFAFGDELCFFQDHDGRLCCTEIY